MPYTDNGTWYGAQPQALVVEVGVGRRPAGYAIWMLPTDETPGHHLEGFGGSILVYPTLSEAHAALNGFGLGRA